MKKRTFVFAFSIVVILSISFNACQKFDKTEDENMTTEDEIALRDANFSPEFNWESSRVITLNISSASSQILNITSTDKEIRYYKGILIDNSKSYVVKISVPTSVNKLSVNNQELSLNSDNLSVNL